MLLFLQLDELKLAEWLEDCAQVILCDGEVDVANVEAMEGYAGVLRVHAALGIGTNSSRDAIDPAANGVSA